MQKDGGALRRRFPLFLSVAVAGVMLSANLFAAETAPPPPGATLESLLEVAHRLSPTLKAAALETSAAAARADRADALDDPTLSLQTMQVPGHMAGMDQTTILLQQEFPLWGKRDLRKSAALAMLDAARGDEKATAAELDEKIALAFAAYWKATRGLAINVEATQVAADMVKITRTRFSQGVATSADLLSTEADATRAALERVRFERERRTAIAQINLLLARPASATLSEPRGLQPLPTPLPMIEALMDRARTTNPVLLAGAARVRSAEAEEELARKSWYPDLTVGAGPQTNFGAWGYAASIGIKIPLQRGAKESGEAEAAASLGAARARLAASEAELEGDLTSALAALEAAEAMDTARRGTLAPEATAFYRAALAEYASGRGDLISTLDAVHRLHQSELELLDTEMEGQAALARIERLLGARL
ncbi:MAG: TolC family protein [Reyranella sp.]|nr:TolC family protein [Reyranella sp.]